MAGTIPEHRASAGVQRSAAPHGDDEKTIAPGEIRTPDPLVRRETRERDNNDRRRQHATAASSIRPVGHGKSALDGAGAARAGTIPEPRSRASALIYAAVRPGARRLRGFILLDGPATFTLVALLCLLAFVIAKDERAAERDRAELVAIAEECLYGWEQTIGDLNVCADVREHYEAGAGPCLVAAYGLACTCWAPGAP